MNIASTPWVPTPHRTRRIVCNVAVAVIATISIAACSAGASDNPTAAETGGPTVSTTASPPSSIEATATVGPGRGTGSFAGSAPAGPGQVTIPDYNENVCKEDKFGIFLIASDLGGDAAPNLWAQAAKQQNTLWILDVDGTRLVILAGDPGNMSAQDRTDLDG